MIELKRLKLINWHNFEDVYKRQQKGNELLPGEQRRLMERGRFGCCHRFLRNGNEMHLDT